MARQRGDRLGTCNALYNLAQVAMSRGDHELATRMFEEGLALSEQIKDQANLAHFLEALAAVAAFRGEVEHYAHLLGAAEALLEEVGARVYSYYVPDPSLQERAVAEARTVLGDTTFEEARAQGRTMTFEQAVKYALERGEALPTTPS